jgi:hypothetical protein
MTRRERLRWIRANFGRLMSNIHFAYAACSVVGLVIMFPLLLLEKGPTLDVFLSCGFFAFLGWTFFNIGISTVEEQMQIDENPSTIEGGNDHQ